MTEERKKILAAVTERAENFVKGFDPEFAAGYMKKREEAEAEELLIRAGELMDQTFPVKEPVIDGLLYKGVYLFAGAPKIGKSFLVLQIAYAVSTQNCIYNADFFRCRFQ